MHQFSRPLKKKKIALNFTLSSYFNARNMRNPCVTALQCVTRSVVVLEGLLSEFRAVKRTTYCPELAQGSKTTVSARNFTFSVHVDIWWRNNNYRPDLTKNRPQVYSFPSCDDQQC